MNAEQQPGENTAQKAAPEAREEEKAYLLYAVWFREKHGAQRYREYLEAASPIARDYGARRVEFMLPVEVLRGDFEPDYISIIEWPSVDAYYEFLKDVRYSAVAPLREEAVAKSAIVHCRRFG